MVKINIDIKDIKKVIQKLPARKRTQLIEEIQEELWGKRIDTILKNIDKRRKKHKISDQEISEEIEKARQEFYARRR